MTASEGSVYLPMDTDYDTILMRGYYSSDLMLDTLCHARFSYDTGEFVRADPWDQALDDIYPGEPGAKFEPVIVTYKYYDDYPGLEALVLDTRTGCDWYLENMTMTYCPMVPSGDYMFRLEASDYGWSSNVETICVSVDNDRPVAVAGPDQTVEVGDVVTLDGSASTDNIGIIEFRWTIVDGDIVQLSGPIEEYVFETPGTYLVDLTVWDWSNLTDSDTVFITVIDPSPSVIIGRDDSISRSHTWTHTSESDELLCLNITNYGLYYILAEVYDVSSGDPILVLKQRINLKSAELFPTGHTMVDLVTIPAGHTYEITVTAFGQPGSYAMVGLDVSLLILDRPHVGLDLEAAVRRVD
jgi:hypothetical protein